jgi:hypothetical protein
MPGLNKPAEYYQRQDDLAAFAYNNHLFLIYENGVYRDIETDEQRAVAVAEKYSKPAIYEINKAKQESHQVY